MLAKRGLITPPWGVPCFGSREDPVLQHPRVEPFADQSQDHTIAHPTLEELPQMAVVDRVEEFPQIDVHDPVASQLHRLLPQRV